jgi:hypothetical protein
MHSVLAFGYLPYLYFLEGTIFKIPLLMIGEVGSNIGLSIPYIVSKIKPIHLLAKCGRFG